MANAMLDARQEDDSYRRVEVITGERRRRRWTGEEKARIVAESFEEGRTSPRWRGAMAFPAGCSRYGDARLRRRWPRAHRFVPIRIGTESPAAAERPVPVPVQRGHDYNPDRWTHGWPGRIRHCSEPCSARRQCNWRCNAPRLSDLGASESVS